MTGNDDLYLSSAFTDAISAKTDHESIANIQADLKTGMERGEVVGVSLADDTFMMIFPYDAQDPARWEAIGALMRGMMRMAKAATRVSLDTRVTEENEKYYARSWLVRMGYGGPEHKELRATLLDHLKGYTAFKTQAEQARREFTANVSHELKTPLHVISGYAELMQNGFERFYRGDKSRSKEIPGTGLGLVHRQARRPGPRRGNCYDNAMAENFFSILKTECIYRHKPITFREANERIDSFIHFYNHERIQLKTGVAPLLLRHSA